MRKTLSILILLFSSNAHLSGRTVEISLDIPWSDTTALLPRSTETKSGRIDDIFDKQVEGSAAGHSPPAASRAEFVKSSRSSRLNRRSGPPPGLATNENDAPRDRGHIMDLQPSRIPAGPSLDRALARVTVLKHHGISSIPRYSPGKAEAPRAQPKATAKPGTSKAGPAFPPRDPIVEFKAKQPVSFARTVSPATIKSQSRQKDQKHTIAPPQSSRTEKTVQTDRMAEVISPFASSYAQGFGPPPGLPRIKVTGDVSGGIYTQLYRDTIKTEAQGPFANHIPSLQLPKTPKLRSEKPPGLPRPPRW